MFGDSKVCGAFPTSAPRHRVQGSIVVNDNSSVVRLHSAQDRRVAYACFDEQYFKTFEAMQWNRDNGYIELIPIIVGLP
jgi:hypothetical protein